MQRDMLSVCREWWCFGMHINNRIFPKSCEVYLLTSIAIDRKIREDNLHCDDALFVSVVELA